MKTKNINSTSNYLSSRQLKLFDFDIPEPEIPILYQLSDIKDMDLTGNMTFDFVMVSYNYTKLIYQKYSSRYSKKTFTQPQLYALLSYKVYNKFTYRKTMENLEFSDILQYCHFHTQQKINKDVSKYIKQNEISEDKKIKYT